MVFAWDLTNGLQLILSLIIVGLGLYGYKKAKDSCLICLSAGFVLFALAFAIKMTNITFVDIAALIISVLAFLLVGWSVYNEGQKHVTIY